MELYPLIDKILERSPIEIDGYVIGKSVKGRSIQGFTFGNGTKNISLIAGNHADEPVGPLLLKKLVSYLFSLPKEHYLLENYSWYIVPHTNPDGESRNKKWYTYDDTETDLANYLTYVTREQPGEDLEFGYPIEGEIEALRPENTAVYKFWKTANIPFHLHVSLHGMAKTYGPWFLIDNNWKDRTLKLQEQCHNRTTSLGYKVFDLDRKGEKGFYRIDEGFCTRPDSKRMRDHFLKLNDTEMANKFHPSSMESIRSLGGDCLTLVSEMPLFLFPKKERDLIWPDPYLQQWSNQFSLWKMQLQNDSLNSEQLKQEMKHLNVYPMLWEDQMRLQWQLVISGIQTIS
ncbi:peptidase [Flavobacteriaceae bacterium AU392]|nr:peptidase [Flavobacteriaceae bacterium]RKM84790.1 peptidase [Flavobacteriaceae bacterium AU392]